MIRTILVFLLLSFSLTSQSTTLSYSGYTLDTSTNIVTGGGLQWLRWDQTLSMSIDQALQLYGADGWRLAANTEVATLMNAFDFGVVFTDEENIDQGYQNIGPSYTAARNALLALFGNVDANDISGIFPETIAATFGSDLDADNLYNLVLVAGPSSIFGETATILLDQVTTVQATTGGIALVRTVPVPGAAWMFGAALLSLVARSRSQKTR